MIDEKIILHASEFAGYWNGRLSGYPRYSLDLSYPSLGTIDLILGALRGKREFDEAETAAIYGASCYIAGIVHDCWSRFDEKIEINLELLDGEVTLSAKGGKLIPARATQTLPLGKRLRQIIEQPPQPFKFFESFSRTIHPDDNLVAPLALGFATGLSPYGDGPWRTTEVSKFVEPLEKCVDALAEQTAKYYSEVFPGEKLGTFPELYLADLILPPLGYQEPYPCLRGAARLATIVRDSKMGTNEALRLLTNLATIPDELISLSAILMLGAMTDETILPDTRFLLRSRHRKLRELRPAFLAGRAIIDRPNDWLRAMEKGDRDAAFQQFELERELGFLPSCTLSANDIFELDSLKLARSLTWNQSTDALDELNRIASSKSHKLSLRLQRSFLLCGLGSSPELDKSLLEIEGALTKASDWERALYCYLCGRAEEFRGNKREAFDLYKQGLQLHRSTFMLDAAERMISLLMSERRHADIVSSTGDLLKIYPWSSYMQTARLLASTQTAPELDITSELRPLISKIPMDRALFALLLSTTV